MRRTAEYLILLFLAACCLVSCSPGVVHPQVIEPTPSPLAVEVVTAAGTNRATVPVGPNSTIAAPTAMPTSKPSRTSTPGAQSFSGWSIYSNPDYVRGIALYQNHLWAATLGGVVDWNLDTQAPVVYTARDGLVEIQGNDVVICPMPEPRVIISHEAGILSAYDLGLKKWSKIPITFNDGTTFKSVNALHCDIANNRLLVGSADGLGILNLKTMRWQRIGKEEGLHVDAIESIDVVGQSIWLAAGKQSAFLIMGKSIFPFNGASGFPSGSVNDLSVAPDSTIWFGYPTGLVRYKDKRWYSYGTQSLSGGIPFKSVEEVEVGQENTIWIASADEGICPFDRVTHFCSTIYPAPQDASVTDLVAGDDGVAYASTDGGGIMVLQKDQRETLLVERKNLLSNDILDISEGRDGTLWIATSRGVNYFDSAQPFNAWETILPETKGLGFARVSGILPVSAGVWFINDQEPQVSYRQETGWITLDASKGISGRILDAALDERGYAWFATEKGIDIWDGVAMRSYGPGTGLPGNVYHALFEQGGTMWVGSDQGLLRYTDYQWSVVLSGISVNAIALDLEDRLLLGSDQGLIVFDGSQGFQWLINLDTLVLKDLQVTAVSQDKRGDLWVGTRENGLFHYTGLAWERFDTSRGMPTNTIRTVFIDHLGAVWVAATTGQGGGALMRYKP